MYKTHKKSEVNLGVFISLPFTEIDTTTTTKKKTTVNQEMPSVYFQIGLASTGIVISPDA